MRIFRWGEGRAFTYCTPEPYVGRYFFTLLFYPQEDDLQHLQFFTHYGKLVEQEQGGEGSQKLFILVRDWQFPYEKQFGIEGGAELLR